MLDEKQALQKVKEYLPDATLKFWALYNDLYLVQVEYPGETLRDKIFDPYYSVNVNTGEVIDFSILPDIDIILNLEWHDIRKTAFE